MTISLPTDPYPNGATPFLRDFGGILTPFLGGAEQRINRIGTRFGIRVTMPPLPSETTGRTFVSALLRARAERLLMPWPLLSFDPGTPPDPKVKTAISGGSAVALKGLGAGYQAKNGQFISFVHASRRYVHMITGDGIADGAGDLTVGIFPPLRVALSVNDVVEVVMPMIEGHVLPGDELGWEMALDHNIGLSFSVYEGA